MAGCLVLGGGRKKKLRWSQKSRMIMRVHWETEMFQMRHRKVKELLADLVSMMGERMFPSSNWETDNGILETDMNTSDTKLILEIFTYKCERYKFHVASIYSAQSKNSIGITSNIASPHRLGYLSNDLLHIRLDINLSS